MAPIKLILIFALGLFKFIEAQEAETVHEPYTILARNRVENGTITFYKDTTFQPQQFQPSSRLLRRSCGTTGYICDDSNNLASVRACATLLLGLSGPYGLTLVQGSPQSACIKVDIDNSQCCLSWSSALQSTDYYQLTSAAALVNNGCQQGGYVSGVIRNTFLSCFTICLSNRPNGCETS